MIPPRRDAKCIHGQRIEDIILQAANQFGEGVAQLEHRLRLVESADPAPIPPP